MLEGYDRQVASLFREIAALRDENKAVEAENGCLRQQVAALDAENATMRRRVSQIEGKVDRIADGGEKHEP